MRFLLEAQRQLAGSGLKLVLLLLIVIGGSGCQTPFLTFNGGLLAGPVSDTESFAFASRYKLLKLEVRPEKPYSVILRVVMRDDRLYIDSAGSRRWHTYLKQNTDVRVGLGDSIYLATAVRVADPELTRQFPAGRTIYRIVPRKQG